MSRRRLAAGGLVLALGVSSVSLAAANVRLPWTPVAASASPGPSAAAVQTDTIQKRTMQTSADLSGTLGYEGSSTVAAGAPGTVTSLPALGTVIGRNGVLYELDGVVRPRLFFGARPMWRSLGPGVTDGADVLQLEQNLRALGYASKRMHVNSHWDSLTTAAVKRWQKATGQTVDGKIDRGDIVFLPGPVRVASLQASLGANAGPGAPILGVTTATRVVTLDLAATRQDLVKAGQAVTITLPDDSTVDGTVRGVGRVATPGQNGNPATVPVTIDLDPGAKLPELDSAPVTVHVVTESHADVLAVPVNSLVALLEGGYAVELVKPDGSHHYVAVKLGLFGDGWVEVQGDGLSVGDTVVVAR